MNRSGAIIFDSRSIFDRGFYASQRSEEMQHMRVAKAATCSSLMVLLPILSGYRLDKAYSDALFCWDGGRKTDKPRKPHPPGFDEALEYFKALLPTLVGGAHVTAPGEGDDAVATAAIREAEAGRDCLVVSGDKDMHQLVGNHIGYYCLNQKSLLSAPAIMDKYGIKHPSHVAIYLAIVGDKIDGIDGVKNWGHVKATKLLADSPVDLGKAIALVESAIPPDQVDNFYAALEATLLQVDVVGIPEPAPIKAAPLDFIDDEELDPIRSMYARFIGSLGTDEDAASTFDIDAEA